MKKVSPFKSHKNSTGFKRWSPKKNLKPDQKSMKMMILVLLVVLVAFTESIPINSASNLRFSGVEGGSCQGGEHRPFLTKNHPVPYTDSAPFELTLPDGTTESIPVQPASERSTGTCEERSSCELSPTETNNGASGCESEAASVVCCSETKCEAFDGRQGVCMLDSKCAVKEDAQGKYESISDIVYVGTAKGAKGCRHLKDDVRCCVPVSSQTPTPTPSPTPSSPTSTPTPAPPSEECDKCDGDDKAMCLAALLSCTADCTTDPLKCVQCLEEEGSSVRFFLTVVIKSITLINTTIERTGVLPLYQGTFSQSGRCGLSVRTLF